MDIMVRLWTHGETTDTDQDTDAGYDETLNAKDHSVDLPADLCDEYYSTWAASDYDGSFYDYVQQFIIRYTVPGSRCGLTIEDRQIFARLWMHGKLAPITMVEGDHADAKIFDLLAEFCEAFDHGIDADDLNVIEEQSYIYWSAQCDPDYHFDPHYYT